MVKGSSRMDKQNTGDARNSKGTVTMTVLQHFVERDAELKKQIEATKLRGEELKAREKNIDPKLVRVVNGDFEFWLYYGEFIFGTLANKTLC
ncbi:unnamed protein product [Miscanthus lutarioriparius]|uniref:Uncharacterized protein n=1 Tax=Miscanthus lutarioriparius TaxID=422564 RepID=A0A811PQN4_9POAL|nr:unnamed protein product [Miscanthus lutarioriparius]